MALSRRCVSVFRWALPQITGRGGCLLMKGAEPEPKGIARAQAVRYGRGGAIASHQEAKPGLLSVHFNSCLANQSRRSRSTVTSHSLYVWRVDQ